MILSPPLTPVSSEMLVNVTTLLASGSVFRAPLAGSLPRLGSSVALVSMTKSLLMDCVASLPAESTKAALSAYLPSGILPPVMLVLR